MEDGEDEEQNVLFMRIDAAPKALQGTAALDAPPTPQPLRRRASLFRASSAKDATAAGSGGGAAEAHRAGDREPLLFAFADKTSHSEWLELLQERCGDVVRE